MLRVIFPLLLVLLGTQSLTAVEISLLFRDHAVVQRNMKLPIWGFADPGEQVTAQFAGQTRKAKTDTNGRWVVTFDPVAAPGPYELVVKSSSGKEVRSTDILAGEVWVFGGQSNMETPYASVINAKQMQPKDLKPLNQVREFKVGRYLSYQPSLRIHPEVQYGRNDITWLIADSFGSVRRFGALAFPFGRDLTAALDGVPVGIVRCCWGSTRVEGWMPQHVLKSNKQFSPILKRWRASMAKFPNYQDKFEEYALEYAKKNHLYNRAKNLWKKELSEGKAKEDEKPDKPAMNVEFDRKHQAFTIFNGMVYPLKDLAFRGVVFYQGESNASEAWLYRELFPAMIQSWRDFFGRNFPFIYVQICMFRDPAKAPPATDSWAELREAQLMTLKRSKNTAMIVSTDVAEYSIHPNNKEPLGERAALAARNLAYGHDVAYQPPLYRSHKVQDGKVVITFDHATGGLKLPKGDSTLKGFALAGKDKKWVWADQAVINGNTVTISNTKVPEPVAVRFGWGQRVDANLFNGIGIPASPFRTDDWKMATKRNQ